MTLIELAAERTSDRGKPVQFEVAGDKTQSVAPSTVKKNCDKSLGALSERRASPLNLIAIAE